MAYYCVDDSHLLFSVVWNVYMMIRYYTIPYHTIPCYTTLLGNNRMTFLPIPELVATSPRSMNPRGRTWERVLALTRQPNTVPPPAEGEKPPSIEPTLR